MEDLSSPISIASSTPTAPTSASKVTYTTAGTPYNPSTSQPLQPPARRGRSLKWPAGLPAAGLSLLPKSVLATLPLKAGSRSSSLQQYSPQTPYDRASSPLNDTDHRCSSMSAQVPRLVSSATPSPLTSLFSEAEQGTFTDVDPSEESDEECELGMDPLMNMTVKSLHNLASYPNPNQKRAQKALLRGLKPALGLKTTTHVDEPLAPLTHSFGLQDASNSNTTLPNVFHPTQTEKDTFGRSFDDAFWNSQGNKSPSIPPGASRNFNRAVGSNTARTAGTLAPGSGAPRPLTAGPPGQRQYRPSTFESTFKALHTNEPSQDVKQDEDEDVLIITRQTLRQAGISNNSLAQNISSFEATASLASKAPEGLEGLSVDCKTTQPSAPTTAATRGFQYPTRGASSWGLGAATTSACLTSSPELNQSRYTSGPRFRTAKELQAYNNKISHAWYYGADFLVAAPSEIALQVQPPKGKGQFGAIGDGRPSKKGEFHRRMEIEDANRMSVADHARPLFNMAHANVQQFIEGGWNKSRGGRAAVMQATK
ncbi:uncharacterized protein BKA55DRAFT_590630 [Fusarium redolens]|jgi:hypothetical protein|uniref:Uncharacterized protein n=1 Tax=Fusarium redolens TaxID=48865 RepID=A0A9P9HXR2_FUSRE|nr:uncharacterized protein BKA55DRAFT_590630 [Fusarium redolens]KAH7265306.1 hypothetical protein BKA55DRAFT_590630 [Fusarium redolens]